MYCKAGLDHGGRCRFTAVENGWCAPHGKMLAEGKSVKVVQKPRVIKFNLYLDKKTAEQLAQASVPYYEVNVAEKDGQRREAAEKIRRKADRYREQPDAGVPVLGTEGAKRASLLPLLAEIKGDGYRPTNCFLRTGKQSTILVINYDKESEEKNLRPEALSLLTGVQGKVEIWDNPARDDWKVANIKVFSISSDMSARNFLFFNRGVWGIGCPTHVAK